MVCGRKPGGEKGERKSRGPHRISLATRGRCSHKDGAMNKSELVENVQKSLGDETTKRAAEEAVEAVLGAIAQGIRGDRKVQIVGFGTFDVKERAARQGRNPKTGESMPIAASKSVGFKPSAALKGSL